MIAKALIAALLVLSAAAAVATAQDGGRIDDRGTRLLAERAGDRVCLTISETFEGRRVRLRRCLPPSRPDTISVRLGFGTPCRVGSRLFGIAPAGTRQVNLGGVSNGEGGFVTVKVRALRIPTRVHPAGGVAFVIRRELSAPTHTLTAYDAERRRLAHRRVGPYPVPDCVELKTAVPASR